MSQRWGCRSRRPRAGRAGHHWRFVRVLDGYGDRHGVGQVARIGGGDYHRVAGAGLVVEHCFGTQLAGGGVDLEVVRCRDAVGQPVVVGVGGPDRRAQVGARSGVLPDAAVVIPVRGNTGDSGVGGASCTRLAVTAVAVLPVPWPSS